MSYTDRWDGKYRRFRPHGTSAATRRLTEDPHGQFMLIDDHDRMMAEQREWYENDARSKVDELATLRSRVQSLEEDKLVYEQGLAEPTEFAVKYKGVTLSSWPTEELANAALAIETYRRGGDTSAYTVCKLWAMP